MFSQMLLAPKVRFLLLSNQAALNNNGQEACSDLEKKKFSFSALSFLSFSVLWTPKKSGRMKTWEEECWQLDSTISLRCSILEKFWQTLRVSPDHTAKGPPLSSWKQTFATTCAEVLRQDFKSKLSSSTASTPNSSPATTNTKPGSTRQCGCNVVEMHTFERKQPPPPCLMLLKANQHPRLTLGTGNVSWSTRVSSSHCCRQMYAFWTENYNARQTPKGWGGGGFVSSPHTGSGRCEVASFAVFPQQFISPAGGRVRTCSRLQLCLFLQEARANCATQTPDTTCHVEWRKGIRFGPETNCNDIVPGSGNASKLIRKWYLFMHFHVQSVWHLVILKRDKFCVRFHSTKQRKCLCSHVTDCSKQPVWCKLYDITLGENANDDKQGIVGHKTDIFMLSKYPCGCISNYITLGHRSASNFADRFMTWLHKWCLVVAKSFFRVVTTKLVCVGGRGVHVRLKLTIT